jgi:hypothetical protein
LKNQSALKRVRSTSTWRRHVAGRRTYSLFVSEYRRGCQHGGAIYSHCEGNRTKRHTVFGLVEGVPSIKTPFTERRAVIEKRLGAAQLQGALDLNVASAEPSCVVSVGSEPSRRRYNGISRILFASSFSELVTGVEHRPQHDHSKPAIEPEVKCCLTLRKLTVAKLVTINQLGRR